VITESGGFVIYDYEHDVPRGGTPRPRGPNWLRQLVGDEYFQNVVETRLRTDECLEHMVGLRKLQSLRFIEAKVTISRLKQLERLPKLKSFGFHWTELNGAHLACLRNLVNLEGLMLDHNSVTDEGLVHLAQLRQLHTLTLDNTLVTAAGLVPLKGLVNLEHLQLQNTAVTDDGLEHLQEMNKLRRIFLDLTFRT
jgi:internalin A